MKVRFFVTLNSKAAAALTEYYGGEPAWQDVPPIDADTVAEGVRDDIAGTLMDIWHDFDAARAAVQVVEADCDEEKKYERTGYDAAR